MEFRLFVYGTLKHSAPAHARYCATALGWTRGATSGRLYEHEEGYPVLVVPQSSVSAIGTRDALADARTAGLRERTSSIASRHAARTPLRLGRDATLVLGEVLAFDSRRLALAELDEYEGFRPDQPSLFVRALVDVVIPRRASVVKAWTYVAGPAMPRCALVPLPAGMWRP